VVQVPDGSGSGPEPTFVTGATPEPEPVEPWNAWNPGTPARTRRPTCARGL